MYHSPERAQQVADLLASLPACRLVNRDQSLYEVPVRLADGRVTNLRVSLPPNFPAARPSLAVTQPLTHAWVDGTGRLATPGLRAWAPSSRLAPVVGEALAALAGDRASAASGLACMGSSGSADGWVLIGGTPAAGGRATGGHSASGGAAALTRAPTLPGDFPQLHAMGAGELAALAADEAKYAAFVRKLAAASGVQQVQAQLRKGNVDLARGTLAREADLSELRNQIAIIWSSEYVAAKEAFDEPAARQAAVLEKVRPAALASALARRADEVEAASDALLERFIAGEAGGVDAFVAEYVKLRTRFHERDLKRQAAEQTLGERGAEPRAGACGF
ncbi:hypothetical protein WJX81_006726 [Elliptochloris bilobata]|uniref:VPS37 C-terminal domain-containing protein n=1 Tax=Elliptochloris bilobata TaxID=381761 RepID=A0AAW1SIY9_9CHLO